MCRVGLAGKGCGGIREDIFLRLKDCPFRGFRIGNFFGSRIKPGKGGGDGNFTKLCLLSPVFLAGLKHGFAKGGHRGLDAEKWPVNANIRPAFRSLNIQRLIMAFMTKKVQSVEFFITEGLENIEKFPACGSIPAQPLELTEGGFLGLKKRKGFLEARLKIPRLPNGRRGHAVLRQVAGIEARSLTMERTMRTYCIAPVVGGSFLRSARGKRGDGIVSNGKRHILCLVVRIPFRVRADT